MLPGAAREGASPALTCERAGVPCNAKATIAETTHTRDALAKRVSDRNVRRFIADSSTAFRPHRFNIHLKRACGLCPQLRLPAGSGRRAIWRGGPRASRSWRRAHGDAGASFGFMKAAFAGRAKSRSDVPAHTSAGTLPPSLFALRRTSRFARRRIVFCERKGREARSERRCCYECCGCSSFICLGGERYQSTAATSSNAGTSPTR
jgi:hypothetical protein